MLINSVFLLIRIAMLLILAAGLGTAKLSVDKQD